MATRDAMSETDDLDPSGASRRAFAATPLAIVAGLAGYAADAASAETGHPSAAGQYGLQQLFARYAWSYDCNDEELFLSLFLPDAVVVAYPERNELYKGREAIGGWFRFLAGMRDKEGNDWQHDAYNHYIVGDDKGCIVYSYATHFFSNRGTKELGVRSAAYLVSECVNVGGAWYFRRFSVNHWDRGQVPWKKPLPWEKIAG